MQRLVVNCIIEEKMNEFEDKLERLSKPEITNLKHEAMISEQVINMKRKTALSWWWVLFPVYFVAILIMKSFYFPGRNTFGYLTEFIANYPYFSFMVLAILPVLTIVINLLAIKKIWLYSVADRPGINFLRLTLFPALLILISTMIIVTYIILV